MNVRSRIHDTAEPLLRTVREYVEDQWFDRTRSVDTSGNVPLQAAGVRADEVADSELYQPARPRHIRQAVREALTGSPEEATFIDLGCGKGRTLFIAAEFGFRAILGVEFSPVLFQQAAFNALRFRHRAADRVQVIYGNARDFVFPSGPLVLYMFNPFGPDTMQQVLVNLRASLAREPRPVSIILLWPRCEDLVAHIEGIQLRSRRKEYQIFTLTEKDARRATLRPAS